MGVEWLAAWVVLLASEGFTSLWRVIRKTNVTRPSELVRTEARALLELAIRLDGPMQAPFARAADLVVEAAVRGHRVIVLGMGKSGLIARKIAATLCSTGNSGATSCIRRKRSMATSE